MSKIMIMSEIMIMSKIMIKSNGRNKWNLLLI